MASSRDSGCAYHLKISLSKHGKHPKKGKSELILKVVITTIGIVESGVGQYLIFGEPSCTSKGTLLRQGTQGGTYIMNHNGMVEDISILII